MENSREMLRVFCFIARLSEPFCSFLKVSPIKNHPQRVVFYLEVGRILVLNCILIKYLNFQKNGNIELK